MKALKTLRWVATFNGKKEEGEKLSLEVGAGLKSWTLSPSCLASQANSL